MASLNTCVVTLYDNVMHEVGRLCTPTIARWAATSGYAFRCFAELLDSSLAPSWNKILAVQKLLPDYDRVVWMDADCLVTNHFCLDDYYSFPDAPLAVSRDWNGWCMAMFVARNCPFTLRLLDILLFLGDVSCDSDFGVPEKKWEQNALKVLSRNFPSVMRNMVALDSELITDKPWKDHNGVYPVHHHGGVSIADKLKNIKAWLARQL